MSSPCWGKLAGSVARSRLAANCAFIRIRAQRSSCMHGWGTSGQPRGAGDLGATHSVSGKFSSWPFLYLCPWLVPSCSPSHASRSGPQTAASLPTGSRREHVHCDLESCVWHVRLPRRSVGFSPVENLGGDNNLPREGLSVPHRWTKALSVSPGWFNQMSLNM